MSHLNYAIASIGLSEADQKVMLSMMTLSKTRQPSFSLFEAGGEKKAADILLVDSDDATALNKWTTYLKKKGDSANIVSVLLSQEPPMDNENDANYYLKKPLSATVMLSILEKAVNERFSEDNPDLFLGMENNENTNTDLKADGINALVVDDSLPVRIQMKRALTNVSRNIDFAETGEDAEKMIDANQYDIIFLDVILPGVDGYDVCKRIKKNSSNKDTPVIMLTSNSSPADRMKGKMAGCDTYLIKPVNHEIFKEVIYEYLDLEV